MRATLGSRKVGAGLAIFGVLVLASVLAPVVRAETAVTSIPLLGDPFGIAYDSGKSEVFVANQVSETVSVLSDQVTSSTTTSEASSSSLPLSLLVLILAETGVLLLVALRVKRANRKTT